MRRELEEQRKREQDEQRMEEAEEGGTGHSVMLSDEPGMDAHEGYLGMFRGVLNVRNGLDG